MIITVVSWNEYRSNGSAGEGALIALKNGNVVNGHIAYVACSPDTFYYDLSNDYFLIINLIVSWYDIVF